MTDPKVEEKMFSFSKEELAHLEPVYAVFQSMNTGIQHYIITQVYARLGITPDKTSRYDIPKGTITILEPKTEDKKEEAKLEVKEETTLEAKPEVKLEEKPIAKLG